MSRRIQRVINKRGNIAKDKGEDEAKDNSRK